VLDSAGFNVVKLLKQVWSSALDFFSIRKNDCYTVFGRNLFSLISYFVNMSDSKKNFSKTNLSWNIFISLWRIHGKLSTNTVEFNYFVSGVHWVKIVSESIFAKVICRPLLPVFLRYPLCKTCLVKRRTGTSLIKFLEFLILISQL